ncbi:AAA family ATPase [Methylocucumis oryzae]|uniref:AAA family ATPase n=1 Tax=Methylocucumis oryzae TaxID=1632867 RepID=UPI000696C21F|nr:AAA family ATPase [Methylocucumis oryzae]
MLPSFYIENFRLFDTLSINRLSRVNLVAGKNNVGKSAFLEAVLLYVSDASFEKIHALIQSRQENFDPDSRNHLSQLQLSPFKHFFKGHKIPSLDDKGIILAEKKDTSPLVIKIAAYIIEDYDDKRIRRKLSPQESSSFNPDELKPSSFEISLVTEKDGITQPLFPFLSEAMDLSDLIRLKNIGVRIQSKKKSRHQGACQFVSTQGLNDDEAAELWDSINLTDLEADVMNGLKLVENKITGLAFVKSENSNDRIPVIKLKDHEDRIPLKSLGDGVTKSFSHYFVVSKR